MNCPAAQAQLQDYLDGRLPPAEATGLEAHLATCATCRAEWALLSQVDDALATFPILNEPRDLTAQIIAQIQGKPAAVPPPARFLHWEDAVISTAFAYAAASLLLAIVLLWPRDISFLTLFQQE